MLAQIKAYAEADPDVPFVRGEAWNMGVFPNESPRKEWLDEIVPDRPVYLSAGRWPTCVSNHRGYVLARIHRSNSYIRVL